MGRLDLAALHEMFDDADSSTIYFGSALREMWPQPLATIWRDAYPNLFDDADFRQLKRQPGNHFREWLTAIHHHHAYGVNALVEKYFCSPKSHPRKHALLERIVGAAAAGFLRSLKGQPPDLLVYDPDLSRYWFVEVKAPGEPPTETQPANFRLIRERLGAAIKLVMVAQLPDGPRAD